MKKKGRPRSYDSDIALDEAMKVFWCKGYTATSLDELVAQTKMNKPSLYAAFGNKYAIFTQVTQRFNQLAEAHYQQTLEQSGTNDTLLSKITRYLQAAISLYTGENGQLGCLILSTVTAEVDDPQMQQCLAQTIDAQEQQVKNVLLTDQAQLTANANIEVLTRVIIALLHSISLRARAGQSRDSLQLMVESGIMMITPYLK